MIDIKKWQGPFHCKEYIKAPRDYGVYIIGLFKKKKFVPKYLGRADGSLIRSRLRKHINMKGNKNVKKYLEKQGDEYLFICWKVVENPAKIESQLLVLHGVKNKGLFKWNMRIEIYNEKEHLSRKRYNLRERKKSINYKEKKDRKKPTCKKCKKLIKGNHKRVNKKLVCV